MWGKKQEGGFSSVDSAKSHSNSEMLADDPEEDEEVDTRATITLFPENGQPVVFERCDKWSTEDDDVLIFTKPDGFEVTTNLPYIIEEKKA